MKLNHFPSNFFNLDISQVAVEQVEYWKMHQSVVRQITEYFKQLINCDINENP